MRWPIVILTAALCTTAASQPARHVELAIRLRLGERLTQHVDAVDRTAWILPKKRLAYFAKSGIVINEEQRTRANINAIVIGMLNGTAELRTSANAIVVDVPRHRAVSDSTALVTTVSQRNESGLSSLPRVEDAAMAILPFHPVQVGSRWSTHERVRTQLGSGDITIKHAVTHIDGDFVQVSVLGSGQITGREYNLPRLLPGTIHIEGNAWYDTASKLVTHESYVIHNRLVKPARAEFIGFDEMLTVDITTGIDPRG